MTTLMKRFWLLLFAWCAMMAGLCAQPIGSPSVHKSTGSYADLYKQQLKQTRNTGVSARTYTMNKQFLHNPNVSPYLNLSRPGGGYTPNYQAYVKPEIARRQKAQTQYNNQPRPGRPAGSGTPIASRGNPYYSKYYTGR